MSIMKLIEPLGISSKTVYKYFKNKEALLEEALLLHYSQQYQALEDLSIELNAVTLLFDTWYGAIERAYNINNLLYRDLNYYYPKLERKIEAAIGEKFGGQFLQIVQKGMKEGVFKEDILPQVVMEGIYVLYKAIVQKELFKNFNASATEILLNTIAHYIRGFCTLKGMQILDEHLSNLRPFEEYTATSVRTPAKHQL